jgi:hypothetical protein
LPLKVARHEAPPWVHRNRLKSTPNRPPRGGEAMAPSRQLRTWTLTA